MEWWIDGVLDCWSDGVQQQLFNPIQNVILEESFLSQALCPTLKKPPPE
jgi:hypothetical protein